MLEKHAVKKGKKTDVNMEGDNVLYVRWIALLLAGMYLFFTSSSIMRLSFTVEIFTLVVLYNTLITLHAYKRWQADKRASELIVYSDVVVAAVLIYTTGGVNSELYLLLFFLLGYCGIYDSYVHTVSITVLEIAVYSAACMLSAGNDLRSFDFVKLFLRDMFIVIWSFVIAKLNNHVKMYDELRKKEFKLARTDKLTGLANRHYLEQRLYEEVKHSDCTGNPLNVLIFDLDNFKKFNDTYGHTWGDKLLSLFSDIIKQNIRSTDIPIRYGGEEFLLLIRDIDLNTAKCVGDRIRRQLEKQRIFVGSNDERKKVSVSCGVAQYPMHSKNIREVIDFADKALYHAKEKGKNMVVCYSEINMANHPSQINSDSILTEKTGGSDAY